MRGVDSGKDCRRQGTGNEGELLWKISKSGLGQ
jgi:hypothetical protein